MRYHTLGTIQIPEDVWWTDEYGWRAVEQSSTRGLTGARIVQVGIKTKGRPITLASNEKGGWVPRSTARALHALFDAAPITQTLTLADGRAFQVQVDPEREFSATPVRPAADLTDSSWYRIVLPLIEV